MTQAASHSIDNAQGNANGGVSQTPSQRLSSLLELERIAAISADVERLIAIQEDKRQALSAVQASQPSRDEIEALATAARNNIVLMRHLVQCLRGFSIVEEGAYGAHGERVSGNGGGQLRGRL